MWNKRFSDTTAKDCRKNSNNSAETENQIQKTKVYCIVEMESSHVGTPSSWSSRYIPKNRKNFIFHGHLVSFATQRKLNSQFITLGRGRFPPKIIVKSRWHKTCRVWISLEKLTENFHKWLLRVYRGELWGRDKLILFCSEIEMKNHWKTTIPIPCQLITFLRFLSTICKLSHGINVFYHPSAAQLELHEAKTNRRTTKGKRERLTVAKAKQQPRQ